jgi:hypothetical protein
MKNYTVTKVSEDLTEKERSDTKPSRKYVVVNVGSDDMFDQAERTRTIWLERHIGANQDELAPMKNNGDFFRKLIGKKCQGETFILKGNFDVRGRKVDHSTIFLFSHECDSPEKIEINSRLLAPKAWEADEVVEEEMAAAERA